MDARPPAVAGAFYPSSAREINSMLAKFAKNCKPAKRAAVKAVVAPHAGWVYSGQTAYYSFDALAQTVKARKIAKPVLVILCPNHTGYGAPVALSTVNWLTPLGEAAFNAKVGAAIADASNFVEADENAHVREHAAEVQLPFLQHFFGKSFSFAAIALGDQSLAVAKDLAKSIFEAGKKTGEDVFLVASSDFTHYEPAKQAREKDEYAIEALLKLDSKGFFERVVERKASACGPCAIAAAVEFAKLGGAKKGALLDFSNSGEVSGDRTVVDYASIAFE